MFLVICKYEIKDEWEQKDQLLYQTAGKKSDSAGASSTSDGTIREHEWQVKTLSDARKMKERLEREVKEVKIHVREK